MYKKRELLFQIASIGALFFVGFSIFFFDSLSYFGGASFVKDFESFKSAPMFVIWIQANALFFVVAPVMAIRALLSIRELSATFKGDYPFWLCLMTAFMFLFIVVVLPAIIGNKYLPIPLFSEDQRVPLLHAEWKLPIFHFVGYASASLVAGCLLYATALAGKAASFSDMLRISTAMRSTLSGLGVILSIGAVTSAGLLAGLDQWNASIGLKVKSESLKDFVVPYGVIHSIAIALFYFPCYHYLRRCTDKLLNPHGYAPSSEKWESDQKQFRALHIESGFFETLKVAAPLIAALVTQISSMANFA